MRGNGIITRNLFGWKEELLLGVGSWFGHVRHLRGRFKANAVSTSRRWATCLASSGYGHRTDKLNFRSPRPPMRMQGSPYASMVRSPSSSIRCAGACRRLIAARNVVDAFQGHIGIGEHAVAKGEARWLRNSWTCASFSMTPQYMPPPGVASVLHQGRGQPAKGRPSGTGFAVDRW